MMRQRVHVSRVEDVYQQSYSQSNRRSLKNKLRGNVVPIAFGTIMILAGTILLFWNEGEAVHITKTLDEGFNLVAKVTNSNDIPPDNEGKLVHIWGLLSIPTPLRDDYFGISVKAIHLKRRVQIYQWVEEESIDDAGYPSSQPSFYYSQVWKDKLVDSNSFYNPFGHENPTSQTVEKSIQVSPTVKIGSYYLSPAVKQEFQKFIQVSGDEQPDIDDIKLHNGMYYLCKDLFNLKTGDTRVQFYLAGHDGELVSLIGKQVGETIHPYVTSSGKELIIMRPGKLNIDEMFSSEHSRNMFSTWLFRVGGWFLIFIGMTAISSIIHHLALMSSFVRDMITLGLGSANLSLSMSLSFILIGVAWCFYRPTVAFLILLVATFPMFRAVLRRRDQR